MIVEGITGSRLSFRTKGRKYFGRKGGWGPRAVQFTLDI